MVIFGVGQAGFGVVLTALFGGHPDAHTSTVLLLASFAGVWLTLWAWMRFVEQRPMSCLGFRGRGRDVWVGVAIAVAILVIDVVVMTATGQVTMLWAHPNVMAAGLIVAAIVLFVVQGCAEEAVLRGYLMQSLAARWGIPAGVAIQAVVFAALHGANPGTTWVALVNIAGFGVMSGLLVIWRGNLLAAMGFHTVWNWLQGMVLGFDVSGLELDQSVMTTTGTTGSRPWLTGGTFGAEGSIINTIALAVLIAVLLVTIQRDWRNN
ncbi:CPBP family intramembrane metalloprotease [Cutibacterium sp. WCA-380-WT-3A]|uniref:CPBP family intramembrane metalloprotease n=1 Tax=Cutibacterium porci TaxID=2605781 RepID=A0A7K0J5A9_9ACTN|nr:CPBP family intramembrane glutamic endopeptidase [Cutibacterium porci]MSS45131.1 CPBP family intramembrane metalloprotease [Cutibacterium porci]